MEEGDENHSRPAEVGIPVGNPGGAVQWAVRNTGKELDRGMPVELHRSF